MIDRRPPRLQRAKVKGTIILPPVWTPPYKLLSENKIIQGLWIGSKLSAMENLCIRSFIANGHDFHLYLYGPCEGVPCSATVKDANEILDSSEISGYLNLAVASDMFRYLLLHSKAPRWWVDLDTICLRPFDFTEKYVFASEILQDGTRLVDNGILKVPEKCDLIERALERCRQQDKARPTGKFSHGALAMGPELMTNLTSELGLLDYVKTPSVFTGIEPWNIPNTFIDPTVSTDLSNAYAAHMWQSRWGTTGTNKDGAYSSDSLFERLKQRYQYVR